jgi:hypothetical protein
MAGSRGSTVPSSGATDTTPAAIDDSLQRLADAGIPKAKLGMGVGFYAICYTGGISGPHQPTNGGSQQIVGGDNNYPLSLFFAPRRHLRGQSPRPSRSSTRWPRCPI